MRKLLFLSLIGMLSIGAPALAATGAFTGTLSTFTGGGTGIPTTTTPLPGSGSLVYSAGGFTVPSAVFVANVSGPVGFTPNALPNSLYTIRTVTNSSNRPGSFSGTPGTGPYSGVMGSGSTVLVELGLVPLPNVFGSLVLPVNVGSPGSSVANALVLTNAVTVTVIGNGWTTAAGSISDQTAGAPAGTTASSATFAGTNSLTAGGAGQITLVSPFLVLIRGAAVENRAGYAILTLNITPEPGTLLLLGAGAAGLALLGTRRKA